MKGKVLYFSCVTNIDNLRWFCDRQLLGLISQALIKGSKRGFSQDFFLTFVRKSSLTGKMCTPVSLIVNTETELS